MLNIQALNNGLANFIDEDDRPIEACRLAIPKGMKCKYSSVPTVFGNIRVMRVEGLHHVVLLHQAENVLSFRVVN